MSVENTRPLPGFAQVCAPHGTTVREPLDALGADGFAARRTGLVNPDTARRPHRTGTPGDPQ